MSAASGTPSLAERLGYDADTRLVMVNCDDLGSLHATNVAIIDALRAGEATSATLMVPCPWAASAAAMTDAACEVGVHLTVTSEWEGYRWAPLTGARSLCAPDGRMHRTVEACHRAVEAAGRRGLIELRDECRAQVEQALAWGIDVTHLDAHMGTVQTHPDFVEIYLDLASEHRLPVRMMSGGFERRSGLTARTGAQDRGVLFPDHIVMTYLDARPVIEQALRTLRPGITEFLLHPSLDTPDLRAACHDADERVANDAFLRGPASLVTQAREQGAILVGFRALRDLQRGVVTESPGRVRA